MKVYNKVMDEGSFKKIVHFQREEKTEHIVYSFLSRRVKGKNRNILDKISKDELKHHNFWKSITKMDVKPFYFSIIKYILLRYIFGITFVLKLMEGGEKEAKKDYSLISGEIEGADEIIRDEVFHEKALVNLIDEEKIDYVSSMILGLNDALVELTGALAGFTLSLGSKKTVLLAGFITGFAASLSMAASEYLSTRSEHDKSSRNPIKASLYTGGAYILTVILLLFPYVVFPNLLISLVGAIFLAIFVIYFFTFYVSVVQERPFGRQFIEMLLISMGVAGISFFIGYLVKVFFKVNV